MMTHISHYDYDLPPELIAQQPLANRADARLMLVDRRRERIAHHHVRDLPDLLSPGDCLVVNDTKVVPARLLGRRDLTGGRWEGLLLEVDSSGLWKILARTRGKISVGEQVRLIDTQGREDVLLRMVARQSGGSWVAKPEPNGDWLEVLQRVGRPPLPCYIRRGIATASDATRYQTVYARAAGSAAAPTAGLHFTRELLAEMADAGIRRCAVTLHIGIDTFRPVKVESIEDHVMHSEWGQIDAAAAEIVNDTRSTGGRVVAVGTTSVRVLETAASDGGVRAWSGQTRLFIFGQYQFRAVDALLTNFHFPRSTLLMLVRAFGGDALIRQAYQEAIRERYRFYSYGDAMLIV
jgi:S-adenosylmethionine:tRNA ribosyltransferase-isomerase